MRNGMTQRYSTVGTYHSILFTFLDKKTKKYRKKAMVMCRCSSSSYSVDLNYFDILIPGEIEEAKSIMFQKRVNTNQKRIHAITSTRIRFVVKQRLTDDSRNNSPLVKSTNKRHA